jgi:hypothetical protein
MPTPEQVNSWRALRGRFLNVLWDVEQEGQRWPAVSELLDRIGESDLPDHLKARLVEGLVDDGLISGEMSVAETYPPQTQLTSQGRYEVEEWLATPEQPTEHLPLPANTVFNINTLQGPLVHSSPNANVTAHYSQQAQQLKMFVDRYQDIVGALDLTADEKESVLADLEALAEQTQRSEPQTTRVRSIVRRLLEPLGRGASTGAAAATHQQVQELGQELLQVFQ